jgi:hypothetical protein
MTTLYLIMLLVLPLPGMNQDHCFKRAIGDVELGISTSDASIFAGHLAGQVRLRLGSEDWREFSAKQSYYVLQEFLRDRSFKPFEFSTMDESTEAPFASGTIELVHRGNRQTAQVYVAFSLSPGKCLITAINIH